MEVGDFVLLGLGEDVLYDIGKIEINFQVLLIQSVHFFHKVFNDKGEVVHQGLFGLILHGGTEVGFVVGV